MLAVQINGGKVDIQTQYSHSLMQRAVTSMMSCCGLSENQTDMQLKHNVGLLLFLFEVFLVLLMQQQL